MRRLITITSSLLLIAVIGCGPAHIHIKAGEEPVTYSGKKVVGTLTIGAGGEVVIDFQGVHPIEEDAMTEERAPREGNSEFTPPEPIE